MSARFRAAKHERDEGFTLIELLVVVLIVGIITAIAIPLYLNQRKKGVDASLRKDLSAASAAQEKWLMDNPSALGTLDLVQIAAAGFKKTPGNTVAVATNTTGGYCIIGANPASSAKAPTYFIYDSLGGGFLVGGQPWLFSTYPPGAKACLGSGTTRSAWKYL